MSQNSTHFSFITKPTPESSSDSDMVIDDVGLRSFVQPDYLKETSVNDNIPFGAVAAEPSQSKYESPWFYSMPSWQAMWELRILKCLQIHHIQWHHQKEVCYTQHHHPVHCKGGDGDVFISCSDPHICMPMHRVTNVLQTWKGINHVTCQDIHASAAEINEGSSWKNHQWVKIITFSPLTTQPENWSPTPSS